ncbi:MAG TPA: sensor domain-containing protein [Pseudonocardiaceae bacterium]
MAPRTAWQALTLPPARFLTSSWPWRCLGYLVIGPVLGALAVLMVGGLAVGGVMLAVVGVGVVLIAICLLSGIPVAVMERRRLQLVDLDPIRNPHRRPEGRGWRAWLSTRVREPVTWRELGYAIVSAIALWWIDIGLVSLVMGMPIAMVNSVLTTENVPWYWQIVGVVAAVALLPIAAYPVTAWAAARAEMTRAVLGPTDHELGERLVETTRSRARLVDAFDAEHRRIERDLHDGAQQRLVALSVSLGMARLDVPEGSPAWRRIEHAREQAEHALDELRELVRGIHPQVLTDRGLPAAVADVAGRSPLPVEVDVELPWRLPPVVETTAYFAVCEALVNATKHSRASRATVRGRLVSGKLVMEVSDDGVGGADPDSGTGLIGLADRVAVVDGQLYVTSPPGGPTTIKVELPCPRRGPYE